MGSELILAKVVEDGVLECVHGPQNDRQTMGDISSVFLHPVADFSAILLTS